MTKPKSKIISKYPIQRRTTFKKHSKRYSKVYAPYLPAIAGILLGLSLLLPGKFNVKEAVLSYSTKTSSQSLLDATNNQRISNGTNELSLNSELSKAAQAKADDMAKRDYWSHQTPDGKEPWYFIKQAGYNYSVASENLAYGFKSGKDTVSGWMNSEKHRHAMLDTKVSEVGFGIANAPNFQNKGPETIVVAMYAQPQNPAFSQVKSQFVSNEASAVSFGQLLSGKASPWINLAAGILVGALTMYLVTKHSLKLRRKIRKGEQYILHHPVLDLSLVSLIVLLVALLQTAGFIN